MFMCVANTFYVLSCTTEAVYELDKVFPGEKIIFFEDRALIIKADSQNLDGKDIFWIG